MKELFLWFWLVMLVCVLKELLFSNSNSFLTVKPEGLVNKI